MKIEDLLLYTTSMGILVLKLYLYLDLYGDFGIFHDIQKYYIEL